MVMVMAVPPKLEPLQMTDLVGIAYQQTIEQSLMALL